MTRRIAVLLVTVLGLILVPVAAARGASSRDAGGSSLAVTGVNIFTPILIGLVLLVLGLAFTAWAFLRGGSARRRRDHDRTGTGS